jgi:hypothetical protein
MKQSPISLSAVALAAIVSMSFSFVPARADTVYDWTLSGSSFSGSGTITLSSTEETTNNGGGYDATLMTGEINSVGVTGPTSYFGSDNVVYPSATTVVDGFGLGVLLANTDMIAIDPGGPYNVQYSVNNTTYTGETFTLTLVTATPLPAALPLFASGLGALGLFGWRRKRKNAAAVAAA